VREPRKDEQVLLGSRHIGHRLEDRRASEGTLRDCGLNRIVAEGESSDGGELPIAAERGEESTKLVFALAAHYKSTFLR